MNYKEETKKTYNQFASDFEEKFTDHFVNGGVKDRADLFIENLNGIKVIDLGCGPGMHTEYFKSKGLDVLCIDFSEKMIEICKSKGLNAEVMDIEDLQLEDNSFDGIWAYTSLLHVPKANMTKVIEKISRIIKPQGLLAFALKEGSTEGFEEHVKYPGTKRWFNYYPDAEVRSMFSKFELLSFNRSVFNKHTFISYLYKKI
jgi:ubiquinone/menaquinone biosynthesis C-methylase UbiE